MAHFSLTDLSNRSGEIVEAGPVEITQRGKRKFVLLIGKDYDRLGSAADSRRAFHADHAPEAAAAKMPAWLTEDHAD